MTSSYWTTAYWKRGESDSEILTTKMAYFFAAGNLTSSGGLHNCLLGFLVELLGGEMPITGAEHEIAQGDPLPGRPEAHRTKPLEYTKALISRPVFHH